MILYGQFEIIEVNISSEPNVLKITDKIDKKYIFFWSF